MTSCGILSGLSGDNQAHKLDGQLIFVQRFEFELVGLSQVRGLRNFEHQ